MIKIYFKLVYTDFKMEYTSKDYVIWQLKKTV